jgi:hypothetical protein
MLGNFFDIINLSRVVTEFLFGIFRNSVTNTKGTGNDDSGKE